MARSRITRPPLDVEAVRKAYANGTEPVRAIAKRFGITTHQIWRLRDRFGWPHRCPPPPPKVTRQPSVDVDAVRTAYADRTETVRAIAKRFGITTYQIWHLRNRHGWPIRSASPPPTIMRGPRRVRSSHLVARLFDLTHRALERLEESMGSDETPTIADTERISRALGTIVRNVAKVAELQNDARKRDDGASAAPAVDADALRRTLAERLERAVARRGDAGRDPERA